MTLDVGHRQEIIEPYGSSYATEEAESIDFVALFRILYLRRRAIGLITLACFLVATAAALLLRPRYTATVSFIPPSSSGSSSAAMFAGQLSSVLGAGALGGLKSQGDLYVGILKSRSIASALVQRFDLKSVYHVRKESDAEKRLENSTVFDAGMKDSIVTVTVTAHTPQLAHNLANGYLDALQAVNGTLALTESSQRRLFYEDRLAREKDALSNAEVAFKQVEEKTGLVAPAGQTTYEIQALAQLRAEIVARQTRLASLRDVETNQAPEVLRIQSEIANLEGQAAAMEKSTPDNRFGTVSKTQIPALELEYTRKLRDVKYHEALFGILAKQYEAARIDEDNTVPLQILDRANWPDRTSGPPRLLIVAGGLVFGLLCGCGWAIYRDRFDSALWSRIRTP